VDAAPEAIAYAREHYGHHANLRFEQASCEELPCGDGSFDLVTAFEVIEHLRGWKGLLTEAARVLAPGGQFIVSTPNRLYYGESRGAAGPNPYHEHEFDFEEFRAELSGVFPHVSMFLENHVEGVAFQPVETGRTVEARAGGREPDPASAHFFLAVCAMRPQTGAPVFIYLPGSGNVLRERERHIGLLERELAAKDAWLEKAKNELAELQEKHQSLVDAHTAAGSNYRELQTELENANRWAQNTHARAEERNARVIELQNEIGKQHAEFMEIVQAYEAKVRELDRDVVERTEWAQRIERDLAAASEKLHENERELAEAARTIEARVADLKAAEARARDLDALVEERTAWAHRLEAEAARVAGELAMVRNSRWVRLGGIFRVGPLS
jgi:SAM-dependent methyltransferase